MVNATPSSETWSRLERVVRVGLGFAVAAILARSVAAMALGACRRP
jgi:hypothetical protein